MKVSMTTWECAALASVLAAAGVASAQTRWSVFSNSEYGIRMLVPDTQHCHTSESDHIGHGVCTYPEGITVEVYATPRAMSLAQLRDAAADAEHTVPSTAWQWRTINDAENGYRLAESWSAHGGGRSIYGFIGQSARRTMSHVVFIRGTDAALARHGAAVRGFVNSIHAL